jgi:hypothetical protein
VTDVRWCQTSQACRLTQIGAASADLLGNAIARNLRRAGPVVMHDVAQARSDDPLVPRWHQRIATPNYIEKGEGWIDVV